MKHTRHKNMRNVIQLNSQTGFVFFFCRSSYCVPRDSIDSVDVVPSSTARWQHVRRAKLEAKVIKTRMV